MSTETGAPNKRPNDKQMAERMRKSKEATRKAKIDKAARTASRTSLVRYVIIVICMVIAVGMIAHFIGTSSSHDEQLRSNRAEIADLESQANRINSEAQDLPDADTLVPAFEAATTRGIEMADLQNEMASLNFEVEDRTLPLLDYGDMVDEAREFFSRGALTGGQFLPHGQWYQPHEPGRNEAGDPAWIRMPSVTWAWEFIPIKEVDRMGNIGVLWEARFTGGENDGMLLATVTGKYDPRRGQFFDLGRARTFEGDQRLGATTSPPDNGNEELILAPDERELIDDALGEYEGWAEDREESGSSSSNGSDQDLPAENNNGEESTTPGETADPGLGGN